MDKGDLYKKDNDIMCHLVYLSRGIERLEKLGAPVSFPKDQVLNKIGEIPDCCYLVKSGRVMGYELTYTGEQRIYNLMEPESMFLEAFLLLDIPCPILFKTTMPTTLLKIDKCDLKRAFKRDIDVVLDVCNSLAAKFVASMELVRNNQQKPAAWKLCELLITLAERYGQPYDGKILIKEKISQQTLADMLGMNRVTITRIFHNLKELSLMEQINGYICVRSIEAMREHMELIS